MPEGGKVTPIAPGIVARVSQAARYVISGVSPSTWFGPMQPLVPMAPPEVKGRQFDYPTGYNLNYRPRSYEGVSFEDLIALSESCDILSAVIETRKDQMEALDWTVKIRPDDQDKRAKATPDQQKRIDAITDFFQSPDKEHTFEQWSRALLDQMLVIDAACLWKRPDRKGRLYSLEIIDGSTIKLLLDDSGRRPAAPDPAYQQIIKGVPAADYSSDEMLYLMHNPRAHRVYGRSHVEQIIITVNISIRRAMHQLEAYREGSQPDAFLGLPKEWNQEQIVAFQKHFDSYFAGNLAMRRRLKFMPGDFKYEATKPPLLKDEYDEWLARIICFVFGMAPTPFIRQLGHANVESQHDQAIEEGLVPTQKWFKSLMNHIIRVDFNSPDLMFDYLDDREQDPETASGIRVNEVKAGIISVDEARESEGLDPLGGAYAQPMLATATGYVAPKTPEQQADQDAAAQASADALAAHAKQGHNNGPALDDENGDGKHGAGDDASNKDAAKLGKGVKKKHANPYLPTTAHRH